MPESKKRKQKHNPRRSATQRLARVDGTSFSVKSCCDVDVTVGIGRLKVQHDNWCATPSDQSAEGYGRRLTLTMEIREQLEQRGIRTIVVTSSAGEGTVLLFPN